MNKPVPARALSIFPLVLVLYEVANYLSNDAYLPALPLVARDLNVGNHLVQLTLTAFFLGNATMQLILGPVSERFGRKPVLLAGGVIFVVVTLVCAYTTNIHTMLVARFFQGSAVTSLFIAGYGTIHAMYEQRQAIKTLAWMNSITVLAPALGPLFGALILLVADWRWIFMILAIWAAIALAIIYKIMPETCDKTAELHPAKIFKQYLIVVSNWGFTQPIIALSLLFGAMIAWIAAGPFLVMETFHFSAQLFGLLQSLIFGSFIMGTRCVNWMMNKWALPYLIQISLSLAFMAGIIMLVASWLAPEQLADVIIPMMLLAFGSGIGFPVFNRIAIEASEQAMGIKMAVFASAMSLSGLIGSSVISSFYDGKIFSFALIIFVFSLMAISVGFKAKVKAESSH